MPKQRSLGKKSLSVNNDTKNISKVENQKTKVNHGNPNGNAALCIECGDCAKKCPKKFESQKNSKKSNKKWANEKQYGSKRALGHTIL